MKRLSVFIKRLKNGWVPTAEDEIWKQWVDYRRRENRDLIALLSSDVRDSFKKRAIFLLLVPAEDFNPIYWKEKVGKFYHRPDFLRGLNTDFLNYATNIIVEFHKVLRPKHQSRPEHITQSGGGMTLFVSIPDKYHDALVFYNNCILVLLELLPHEQCKRIFPFYSIQDISSFCNMENASGYNPFRVLLGASNIDETWKRIADWTMRSIIQEEIAGKTKPREEWESALTCYANIIDFQLYGKKLDYSVTMFADQMQFLINEAHFEYSIIRKRSIPRMYRILSDEHHQELRRLIVRFVVLGNGDKEFSIHSAGDIEIAEMMLGELKKEDHEVAERIKAAIDKGNKLIAECQKEQANYKQAEEDIMNQMR